MKKILAILAGMLVFFGCASLRNNAPLIAEYYQTRITKTHVVTEQFFPAKDFKWVLEEEVNDDSVKVRIVWVNFADGWLGVVFDDMNRPPDVDYCGVIFFASEEDMLSFLNEFDTSKIADTTPIPCGHWQEILKRELNTQHPRMDVADE